LRSAVVEFRLHEVTSSQEEPFCLCRVNVPDIVEPDRAVILPTQVIVLPDELRLHDIFMVLIHRGAISIGASDV
jgi:hypothetical protein